MQVYNDALLFASALAMRTERIRIGFAVVQLPFHHPVRLAVQLALLDNLSKGRIDVGVGKGTVYNEYEFVGHGLRSNDSRERMEEAIAILDRLWQGGPVTHSGRYFQVQVPDLRPRPVQRRLPLWRSVISPTSFAECGRLGLPILTARLPMARIRERWALYAAGIEAGGHDAATRERLLEQSALWRNVYVAESNAQAEDELSTLLLHARAHMMHVREAHNPPDFTIDPAVLNPWADPATGDADALEICSRHRDPCSGPRRGCGNGSRTARCRRSSSALPDRVWRHEPRAEPCVDSAASAHEVMPAFQRVHAGRTPDAICARRRTACWRSMSAT